MANKTVDVEEINILLIGDENEINEGIRLIDLYYKKKIVEIIRYKALSANKDDLFDIYQDVILGILENIKKGNYNPDKKSLEAYIYKITSNKATDWLRKKTTIKRGGDINIEELIKNVANRINNSCHRVSLRQSR